MKTKVLFDRSVFHGNKFEELKNCFNNRHLKATLSIYGNPILFEETLGLLDKGKEKELKSHLNFIFEITNSRWFRGNHDIWPLELSISSRNNKYFFMSSSEAQRMKDNLMKNIFMEKLDHDELKDMADKKDEMRTKNKNIRDLCKKMRVKFPKMAKEKGKSLKLFKGSFNDFLKNDIDVTGELIIKQHVDGLANKDKVISDWKKRKNMYPYFTQWVKLFLYIQFHAMVNQSEGIEKNAMLDIGQLTLMLNLDIFVSDDNSFMRSAFMQVYNVDKKFMNLDEFIEFSQKTPTALN